jgi:hypothetical protein
MSGLMKNGALEFGVDSFKEPEKKQTSPRSPVGRTDKRISAKSSGTSVAKPEVKKEVPKEKISIFYYPGGKPISKEQKQKDEQAIEKAFKEDSITLADFEPIIKDVCGVPTIFKKMLFEYVKKSEKLDEKTEKIPK